MHTKKKLTVIIAIISLLVMCFGSLSVCAAYSYGSSFTDYVSTASSVNLATHIHTGRDIGADPIRITAPDGSPEQVYYLQLYVYQGDEFVQYGNNVRAGTATLGGSCYWQNANPDTCSLPAYIRILKITNSDISLGGHLVSLSRTWR